MSDEQQKADFEQLQASRPEEEMQGASIEIVFHDEAPAAVEALPKDNEGNPIFPRANPVGDVSAPSNDVNPGASREMTPEEAARAPLFTPPAADAIPGDGPDEVNLPFLSIKFQSGSEAAGINGMQVEDVIDVAIARLLFLDGKLPCEENKDAINRLMDAKVRLNERTRKRVLQGVEGTDAPHA